MRTLIDEGVRVVGAARTITPELKETGAHTVSADLSTAEGVAALIDGALAELGGIDLLVNNVGGGDEAVMGFLDADDTQWTRMFDINVLATVRATRAALPSLIERRGAVVNISSAVARMPLGVPAGYSAVKAAVTALGRSLSEEFGPHGVRVNTVSPGLVRTTVYEDPDGPVAQLATAAPSRRSEPAAERTVAAPADEVHRYLADMRLHSGFMPRPFYDVHVEEDGVGAGSVVRFRIDFAGGVRELRMRVRITSRFHGENGVAGFVERIIAPRRLHRVHAKELARLDAHAHVVRHPTRGFFLVDTGVSRRLAEHRGDHRSGRRPSS